MYRKYSEFIAWMGNQDSHLQKDLDFWKCVFLTIQTKQQPMSKTKDSLLTFSLPLYLPNIFELQFIAMQ